jgi:hypothetical protein
VRRRVAVASGTGPAGRRERRVTQLEDRRFGGSVRARLRRSARQRKRIGVLPLGNEEKDTHRRWPRAAAHTEAASPRRREGTVARGGGQVRGKRRGVGVATTPAPAAGRVRRARGGDRISHLGEKTQRGLTSGGS